MSAEDCIDKKKSDGSLADLQNMATFVPISSAFLIFVMNTAILSSFLFSSHSLCDVLRALLALI